MARPPDPNPAHPAVSWESETLRDGVSFVRVTCPTCQVRRFELAKSVRRRIKLGTFTGCCRSDARRSRDTTPRAIPHAAVNWNASFVRDHAEWVPVTCPTCGQTRELAAKSVRNQIKRGVFTGLCTRDRLVGKVRSDSPDKPSSPWVDWNDVEVVAEKGRTARRRTLVRVHCPDCTAVRLVNPTYLRLLIKAGSLRPECPDHRRGREPVAGRFVAKTPEPVSLAVGSRRAV